MMQVEDGQLHSQLKWPKLKMSVLYRNKDQKLAEHFLRWNIL